MATGSLRGGVRLRRQVGAHLQGPRKHRQDLDADLPGVVATLVFGRPAHTQLAAGRELQVGVDRLAGEQVGGRGVVAERVVGVGQCAVVLARRPSHLAATGRGDRFLTRLHCGGGRHQ
ncbi:hypothetical protein [Streptomyces sp. NPDC012510]|uniref:hypothetical protein n=1 Tax=Streptomyces sp. NPDC012510 TaxID=3364838 RepID=UPI0036EFF20A